MMPLYILVTKWITPCVMREAGASWVFALRAMLKARDTICDASLHFGNKMDNTICDAYKTPKIQLDSPWVFALS